MGYPFQSSWGFADSSVGKESACNAGGPGSIPGLERSAGKGTEKASDIDIRRGMESAPLTSLIKALYTFSVG